MNHEEAASMLFETHEYGGAWVMNVRYIMDRFFTVDILSKTAAAPGDLSHGNAVQTRPFGVRCPRGVDSCNGLESKAHDANAD